MKKKFKFLAIIIAILTIFLTQNSVLNVYAKEINEVYLGGFTAGFTLKTKGATVIGINDVICDNEISSPSKLGGIKVGDIILSLNGTPINDLIDIENYLKNYKENEEVLCEISRNGHKKFLSITPKKDINGNYKLGVFLKCG
jgi:stage IV sporulation protein B